MARTRTLLHQQAAWSLDLPPLAKMLLIAWLTHADDEGVAWAGDERLHTLTGIPPRTVRKYMAVLEKEGVLERIGKMGRSVIRKFRHAMPQSVVPFRHEVPPVPAPGAGSLRHGVPPKRAREDSNQDEPVVLAADHPAQLQAALAFVGLHAPMPEPWPEHLLADPLVRAEAEVALAEDHAARTAALRSMPDDPNAVPALRAHLRRLGLHAPPAQVRQLLLSATAHHLEIPCTTTRSLTTSSG
jgi:hypothetical protein